MLRKATIQELVAAFLDPRQIKFPFCAAKEDSDDERDQQRERERSDGTDH